MLQNPRMIACRRIHPRVPFRALVEYSGFELFRPDWTLNLSINGIFILTQKPFLVGRKLSIHFELPELHLPVTALAHIVWSPTPRTEGAGRRHPSGMALEFEIIDPKVRSILDQYVTVCQGLTSIDERIGDELPSYIRRELPVPENPADEILGDVTLPEGFLL